jgi:hypothetical protein
MLQAVGSVYTDSFHATHKELPMLKGHFAALLLIVVGTILLLDNLGLIAFSFTEIVRIGWPVLLIGLGIALFFTPGDSKKSK